MKILTLILTVGAIMVCASPAHGFVNNGSGILEIRNERTAVNARLMEMIAIADTFWAARGVTPCANPDVRSADLTNALAAATYPDVRNECILWMDADFFTYSQGDKWSFSKLCAVVIHERGHNGSLRHTETGLMNPASERMEPPMECKRYVNFLRKASTSGRHSNPRRGRGK